jgi:hypothetical protein
MRASLAKKGAEMRVALCKQMPLWSAIRIHRIWRTLSRTPHVDVADLFLFHKQNLALPQPALGEVVKRLDASLFRWSPLGRRTNFYRTLRDETLLTQLRAGSYDIIIPDGMSLVRQPLLEIPRIGVLLFHYGWLPEMRGMNTVEWSAILGRRPATTLFFYDEGIDTGDIVYREEVEAPVRSIAEGRRHASNLAWTLMERFFDDPQAGLSARRSQRWDEGRTYFTLSAPLLDLAESRLSGDRARLRKASQGLEDALRRTPAPTVPHGEANLAELFASLKVPLQDRQGLPADLAVTLLHFVRLRGTPQDAIAAGRALSRLLEQSGDPDGEYALRLANEAVQLDIEGPFSALLGVPGVADALRAALRSIASG